MPGARLICAVPFCQRTRGQRRGESPIEGGEEWLCGDHWRLVSPLNKMVIRRARKAGRHDLAGRAWDRAKRQAIERAFGITA